MLPCHCFFYTHICLHTYYLCNQCHLLDTYSWDNDYGSLEVSFFVFHFLLYCYSNGLELCISGSIGFSSSRLGNMGTLSWSDVILSGSSLHNGRTEYSRASRSQKGRRIIGSDAPEHYIFEPHRTTKKKSCNNPIIKGHINISEPFIYIELHVRTPCIA